MTKFSSLADELANSFDMPFAELTAEQRTRVERDLAPWDWDGMTSKARRSNAEAWDFQNDSAAVADRERVQNHVDVFYKARAEKAFWESRSEVSASDAAVKHDRLKPILKRLDELDAHHRVLRGDHPSPGSSSLPSGGVAPLPGWKMRIQTKASEYMKTLRTSGANPTVSSILAPMVKWCATNNVRTDGGVVPSEGYLRTHVLGGKHWTAPR